MNGYNPCVHCNRKLSSTSVQVVDSEVQIAVTMDGPLKEETKYCLILAQPCPLEGYHLPVAVAVTFTDDDSQVIVPMQKFGFGNIEFGKDLPGCRNRIPLYHNNALQFIDLRCHEKRCYCHDGRR